MKKVSGLVSSFLILLSILLSPNCATLTRRRTQRIPVTSSPAGARVFVNGVEQGVTPLEIWLARKVKGQVIRIESPGYNPAEIRAQRKMSVHPIISNFFLGLIPGAGGVYFYRNVITEDGEWGTGETLSWLLSTAVFGGLFTIIDSVGQGNGYELRPTELTVTLTKADGSPQVDTILIDAEDLQNVKWIRVRRD
jgi:hypothetical protein